MSEDSARGLTTIGRLPWWDLAEVADHDAHIFGRTAWTLNYYWAVKAQPGTSMFAAWTAGSELAGWIVMSAAGSESDVMTIATTEVGRGQGVGRRLLEAGVDWAASRGAAAVHLEVDEHNSSALGLYRSFGFDEWGRRPGYYPGADAILMRWRPPAD